MVSTSVDRQQASSGDVAFKPPCRVATTAAITLSGLQTIDGVALAANDRVLVKNQADQTTNGIYVAASGAWQRAPDVDGNRDLAQGTLVWITSGATYASAFFQLTTTDNPVVIGTSLLTWAATTISPLGGNSNPTVNADSAIAQIGTSISSVNDNAYTGDGLRVLSESNGDINWAQGSTAARLAATAKFGDEFQVVSTTHKFGGFRPIEGRDVWQFRGQTAVFAATIYADASLQNCKMALLQWTGTEDAISGDPISAWNGDGVLPTLAAGWAYVNTPTTLPASTSPQLFWVTGLVSASMTNLAPFVWNDDKVVVANDRLVVSQWDLRLGSTPLPFESMNAQRNLARCQRYAPVFDAAASANSIYGSGFAASTTLAGIAVPFRVAPRVPPTGITVSNATNFQLAKLATTVNATAIAFQSAGDDAAQINVSAASGLVAGEGCILRANNVNCRIEFTGARL